MDWDARATSRFSHPSLPFPVLYLAEGKLTSFWECFGDELNDQPEGDKALYEKTQLGPRRWVRFNLRPSLRVIDVTDVTTLRRIGADAATLLAEYVVTQKWAEALMRHPAKLDGFYYGSRLDGGKRCLAVFGHPSLQATPARLRARANGALLEDLQFLAFLARRGVSVV
ncbi:MAG: RES family NAD+ phosphorylase [Steroidobacteraceae bacterium]